MKFNSCDCKLIDSPGNKSLWTLLGEGVSPGTFCWRRELLYDETSIRTLAVVMPYEDGMFHSLHVLRVKRSNKTFTDVSRPFWDWDGNLEKHTLSPSIACGPPQERNWHGYLKNGRLEACE